jgi:hypothetical protein
MAAPRHGRPIIGNLDAARGEIVSLKRLVQDVDTPRR